MFLTSVINFILYSSSNSLAHAIKLEANKFPRQSHIVVLYSTKIIPPQKLHSFTTSIKHVLSVPKCRWQYCCYCFKLRAYAMLFTDCSMTKGCPLIYIQSFAKTGQLVHTLSWRNTHKQKGRHARAAWLSQNPTFLLFKRKAGFLYYHIPTQFQIAMNYDTFHAYTYGISVSASVYVNITPHVSLVTLAFLVSSTKVSRGSLRCPRANFRML
jgi:hypothetical protein